MKYEVTDVEFDEVVLTYARIYTSRERKKKKKKGGEESFVS